MYSVQVEKGGVVVLLCAYCGGVRRGAVCGRSVPTPYPHTWYTSPHPSMHTNTTHQHNTPTLNTGLRIKEVKEVYEGEVTEITPVETEVGIAWVCMMDDGRTPVWMLVQQQNA